MHKLPNVKCARVRDLLPEYLAEVLPAVERRAVAEHLMGCPACQADVTRWQAIQTALRAEPVAPPPMDVDASWAELAARLDGAVPITDALQGQGPTLVTERDMPSTSAAPPPVTPATAARRRAQRRPRKLPALAAALLVTLLGASVFALLAHRPGRGLSSGPAMTATALAPPQGCTSAAITATLRPGTVLGDLTMVSATEGWAVGGVPDPRSTVQDPISNPVILHYAGCRWSVVPSPSAATGLYSVSMGAPDDGWAVGASTDLHTDAVTSLVVHYTGGRWQKVSLPDIPQAQGSADRVAMRSRDEGWMLISHGKGGYGLQQVSLLHYVHGAWSAVDCPFESPSVLAPVGPNDLWVAGQTGYEKAFLAHYKNGQWTRSAVPENLQFDALHMASPASGWAGDAMWRASNWRFSSVTPVALRYDGTAWTRVDVAPQAKDEGQRLEMFSDAEGVLLTLQRPAKIMPGQSPGLDCCTVSAQVYDHGHWTQTPWSFADLGPVYALTRAGPGDYWALTFYEGQVPMTGLILHYKDGAWNAYGR